MPSVTVHKAGHAGEPVVVIDDFAADPDALRRAAGQADFGEADHHYPGIRADLPAGYMADRVAVLRDILREIFGGGERAELIDASFSIVTTPPADLSVRQRLPHCDAFGRGRIALVQYLNPANGDGTAFYRHRSTGFETIDETRAPIFFDQLEAEMRHGGPPPAAYVAGDTPLFEQTLRVAARYNRALLYRSYLLHSGAISADAILSPDPAVGRLTVTAFLSTGS